MPRFPDREGGWVDGDGGMLTALDIAIANGAGKTAVLLAERMAEAGRADLVCAAMGRFPERAGGAMFARLAEVFIEGSARAASVRPGRPVGL